MDKKVFTIEEMESRQEASVGSTEVLATAKSDAGSGLEGMTDSTAVL